MANFCGKCGSRIDLESGLCPNCDKEKLYNNQAKNIEATQVVSPVIPSQNNFQSGNQVPPPPPKQKNQKAALRAAIISGVCLLIVVVFGVMFFANRDNKNSDISNIFISSEDAIEAYMANKSVWMENPEDDSSYGYSLIDLDFDGVLELISSIYDDITAFSSNKYYRINPNDMTVEEITPENEQDIGGVDYSKADDAKLYKNKNDNKKTYIFKNSSQNGKENSSSWAEVYAENGTVYENYIYSESWNNDDGEKNVTEYKFDDKVVTEDEYNKKVEDFYSDVEDLNASWNYIDGEEFSKADDESQKNILEESYESFDYEGFDNGEEENNTSTPVTSATAETSSNKTSNNKTSSNKNSSGKTSSAVSGSNKKPENSSGSAQSVLSPESAVDIYMANKDVWMENPEFMPMQGYAYCLLDLDFDGVLELIGSTNDGSGRYSYNSFYKINQQKLTVEKMEPLSNQDEGGVDYYSMADKSKLLKNISTGKIFYLFENYTRVSSEEGALSWSETYIKNGKIYEGYLFSEYWHPDYDNNTYEEIREYSFGGEDVSKADYDKKTEAFYNANKDLNLSWKYVNGEEFDSASSETQKQLLLDAYKAFSYDGFEMQGFDSQMSANIPEDALEYNGHYYKIYSDVCSTWEDAKKYCEDLGGHLAVISSQEENDTLFNYMIGLDIETAYFGFTDVEQEGTWTWIEDEQNAYANWNSYEPNGDPGENYAEFYWKYTDGTWNDGNFGAGTQSDSKNFICEWDANAGVGGKTSVNAKNNTKNKSEKELKNLAKKYGNVAVWEYADYDGNGKSEAFAVIDDGEYSVISKTLFISSNGKIEVIEKDFELQVYSSSDGNIRKKDGKTFFWADYGAGGSGWSAILYSVKNNKPYKLALSGNMQGFYQDEDVFYTTENEFLTEGGYLYHKVELTYDSKTQEFTKGKRISSSYSFER